MMKFGTIELPTPPTGCTLRFHVEVFVGKPTPKGYTNDWAHIGALGDESYEFMLGDDDMVYIREIKTNELRCESFHDWMKMTEDAVCRVHGQHVRFDENKAVCVHFPTGLSFLQYKIISHPYESLYVNEYAYGDFSKNTEMQGAAGMAFHSYVNTLHAIGESDSARLLEVLGDIPAGTTQSIMTARSVQHGHAGIPISLQRNSGQNPPNLNRQMRRQLAKQQRRK